MIRRSTGHYAVALAAFAVLTLFWTWPLAANLSSRIPHDPGDSILNIWILWWNRKAVPFTSQWWNAPILFPLKGALALSEHLAGISVFTTPIQLAGGSPLVAYNLALLLSYALSGFFTYMLVLRLSGSRLAAWCGGIAFGLAPYRAGQLSHLQVLTSQWMPAMLLGLHAYASDGQRRWLVVFGVSWLLQALSNAYYMLFVPVLTALWLAWFLDWRGNRGRATAILTAWLVASLPIIPALLKYHEVHTTLGLSRALGDIRQFSATAASFLHPAPLLAFWPAGAARSQEDYLFPGVTAVVLAACGVGSLLFRRELRLAVMNRSALVFYAGAAVVMYVLALGPGGEQTGGPSLFRPYAWLLWLPGFHGLRVPARFAMLGALCLAVAASLGFARLAPQKVAGTFGGKVLATLWRAFFAIIVIAGLTVDGLMERVPIAPPPGRVILPDVSDAAVIEIPPDDPRVSSAAMYRSMFHRQPLISGYTGHTAPHYAILSLSLWRGDSSPLFFLARDRPIVILVNDRVDTDGGFRRMIEAIPAIERHGVTTVGSVFVLPTQPRSANGRVGQALPARISESGRERIEIDLGSGQNVSALEFPLRHRFRDLAPRVLIEASDDGQQWQQVWLGWTGALALEAALQNPLLAPVRIALPDVRARYLRVYPAPSWLGDELTVLSR